MTSECLNICSHVIFIEYSLNQTAVEDSLYDNKSVKLPLTIITYSMVNDAQLHKWTMFRLRGE